MPCQFSVIGLEKIGKRHQHKTFEFPIPVGRNKIKAREIVSSICPEGWVPDKEFNSQDSFFIKDGEYWARTIIRRWVDIDLEKQE
jgi:hypothetical protein